jgi:hypothetical protein
VEGAVIVNPFLKWDVRLGLVLLLLAGSARFGVVVPGGAPEAEVDRDYHEDQD